MQKNFNAKMAGDEKRQNEIIRIQKKRNNFVMLDKGFLDDPRLSFKAKGILAYLLSKPDNWKVIVKDLINHSQDGKKAVYSGLRELKNTAITKKFQ
jgi:ABC-type lipopolysaccharide export system ATPase subunit